MANFPTARHKWANSTLFMGNHLILWQIGIWIHIDILSLSSMEAYAQ